MALHKSLKEDTLLISNVLSNVLNKRTTFGMLNFIAFNVLMSPLCLLRNLSCHAITDIIVIVM